MKEWQFDVLFWVGVGGTILLLIAPAVGLDELPENPIAVTGIGTILAYILTQKKSITGKNKRESSPRTPSKKEEQDE